VRVGLIGAGRIGALHARSLAGSGKVSEIVVVDPAEGRAEATAREVGGAAAGSAEDLAGRVDAMVIAAAVEAHAPMLRLAAEWRVPVFCEKPMAVDLKTADSLVGLLGETGVPAQIGFQRRFDSGYRRAKRLVDDGSLGRLYSVRTTTHDHEPPPAGYSDAGVFRDTLIHDFDAIRFVTGREAVEVYADGLRAVADGFGPERPVDTGVVLLSLSGGAKALMSGARRNPVGHDVRMELFGDGDSVSVGLGASLPLRSVEDGAPGPVEPVPKTFLDRFGAAYRAEIEAFLEVAAGERASPCTPEDAREALRIALACDLSRRERRPVEMGEIR